MSAEMRRLTGKSLAVSFFASPGLYSLDVLLALLVPLLVLLHLSVVPYTKIEESFNIQASHDVLKFGLPSLWNSSEVLAKYDHVRYPELHPVPRTFVAPLALAGASWPFARLVQGVDRQILGGQACCCSELAAMAYIGSTSYPWHLQCLQYPGPSKRFIPVLRPLHCQLVHPVAGITVPHHLLRLANVAELYPLWPG